MNLTIHQLLAEEHRQEILNEMDHIRLEEQALKAREFHPNLFTRSMQKFGVWLIKVGEELVCRFQTPDSKPCAQTRSYAN